MIFDLLTPPLCPSGRDLNIFFAVERPIYVSNSHTKFDWISSYGLGGDSITDRQTDGQRRLHYPLRFFKKSVGIEMFKVIQGIHGNFQN